MVRNLSMKGISSIAAVVATLAGCSLDLQAPPLVSNIIGPCNEMQKSAQMECNDSVATKNLELYCSGCGVDALGNAMLQKVDCTAMPDGSYQWQLIDTCGPRQTVSPMPTTPMSPSPYSPTPSPWITPSSTPGVTITPTPWLSPTPSGTVAPTPTYSPSSTPEITGVPTPTVTHYSPSPMPTITVRPTPSPTYSPTPSPSPTPSITVLPSPTYSPSPTPSPLCEEGQTEQRPECAPGYTGTVGYVCSNNAWVRDSTNDHCLEIICENDTVLRLDCPAGFVGYIEKLCVDDGTRLQVNANTCEPFVCASGDVDKRNECGPRYTGTVDYSCDGDANRWIQQGIRNCQEWICNPSELHFLAACQEGFVGLVEYRCATDGLSRTPTGNNNTCQPFVCEEDAARAQPCPEGYVGSGMSQECQANQWITVQNNCLEVICAVGQERNERSCSGNQVGRVYEVCVSAGTAWEERRDCVPRVCTEGQTDQRSGCAPGYAGTIGYVCSNNAWVRDSTNDHCLEIICTNGATRTVPCPSGETGGVSQVCVDNGTAWRETSRECQPIVTPTPSSSTPTPDPTPSPSPTPQVFVFEYRVVPDPSPVTGVHHILDSPSMQVYLMNASDRDALLNGTVCTRFTVTNTNTQTVSFDAAEVCTSLDGLLRVGEERLIRSQEVGFNGVGTHELSGIGRYTENGTPEGSFSLSMSVEDLPLIAFVRGQENADRALDTRRIWLVQANGLNERRLNGEEVPQFSPEWTGGDNLMYVFHVPSSYQTVGVLHNIQSDEIRTVLDAPYGPVHYVLPNAGNEFIDAHTNLREAIGESQNWTNVVFNDINGTFHVSLVKTLFPDITLGYTDKSWSRNGSLFSLGIMYQDQTAIYVCENRPDITGDGIQDHVSDPITDPRVYIYQRPGLGHGLQFSGDSTLLYPGVEANDFRIYELDVTNVYAVPRGEATVRELTPQPIAASTDRITSFTRCGDSFGYIRQTDLSDNSVGYVLTLFDPNSATINELTFAGTYFKEGLSCDREGRRIVYAADQAHVGRPDTVDRTRLNVEMVEGNSVYQLTNQGNLQGETLRIQLR